VTRPAAAPIGLRLPTLVLAALVATLLGTASAQAQARSGIVRPPDERGIPSRELGSQPYAGNCSMCHGIDGRGIQAPRKTTGGAVGRGPSLRGVGAGTVDFYLRTGYMPLSRPDEQPERSRPSFNDSEIRALVDYVASLPPPGPPIPRPDPSRGDLARGLSLFTEHCAGCHQAVAQGGVVTGARVPPLEKSTPTEIAEAVRTGPYLMPKFSEKDISNDELDSIIRYATWTKHPSDEGGWGIGNIGPVPEGMVTWLLAAVVLLGIARALGERAT
jgi:ubiquinol-cytochrome c reductase cytochrome c subunit